MSLLVLEGEKGLAKLLREVKLELRKGALQWRGKLSIRRKRG